MEWKENDVSRRRPGVRDCTEQRETALLRRWLKSWSLKNNAVLSAASLCLCLIVFFCGCVCVLLTLCRVHLYDLNLLDSCECRGSSVERGGKKGSRGDEKRTRGIKNQVRSNLYLTGNCETAKYKKTFPISALCWCIYSPGLCVCLYVSVFMCRVCVYLEIAFPPQWRETSLCWWAWVVVGPEGLSSVSVSWLVAVWPIRSPGHTVAIR